MNKNFILPDYSKIERIFLVSPINVRDKEGFFEEFYQLIVLISQIISNKVKLTIICKDEQSKLKTEEKISLYDRNNKFDNNDNFIHIKNLEIEYHIVEIVDVWIRDYFSCGTIKTSNLEKSCLKAIYAPSYNSYSPHIDDAAGIKLAQKYFDNFLSNCIPFKLDGGNVIANDEYIIISEKLYTENVNLSKSEIDKYFENNFEQKLITIPTEILDSIGHVDSIVRFITPRTIVLPIYDEEYRADNRYIMKVRNILREKLGLEYKILFLPSSLSDEINEDNIFSAEGLFINFLRLENKIIFPSFKGLEEYQKEIKRVFNKEVPELDIYFSPCDTYAKEGGCFNCITNFIYEIL